MIIFAKMNRTSTEQVPNKYPTSTPTSTPTSVIPESENIKRLIGAVAEQQLSVKEMMATIGLKDRPNFIEYSNGEGIGRI